MIFDTHAHYDDKEFLEDCSEVLASLPQNGIGNVVNVCASIRSLRRVIPMTERQPYIWGAAGVHPDYAEEITEDILGQIRMLTRHEKVVAVGEIGLDYYWHKEEEAHKKQQETFRAQMDIAREEKMPFIIHSRDAAEDTLTIVKEYMKKGMYGGIMHCYSYGKEHAKEYLNMGLYLGIGGVVTFKNGRKLKEVVEMAPLTQLVLETDCPYLAPEPFRGKRNSSIYLPYVVNAIAEIKKVTPEEVIEVTEKNAKKLLKVGQGDVSG